ncbi:hypothetical protein SAZ_42630 [Streptomyces noursei ZPM]|uniref:Uncharacterized protein n=1 Tax=Streptomyces noursei TaxID=1971 RepID=A0A401QS00_STRNR|nr:hypothetical protein [Streptomyces noursei]AKA08276.1 hypothetical protein SAZ_00175 [Streptomyces noursei ZPM]AKA09320.1 hypothetical protein SAZ_42630 [Streptomyces noursei ZPM]EOT02552.1 hypothetical protein K530_18111 [Streptomyces noursei CCRC 11814]EXU92461.1 hypothetical protein P354_21265 [Streptomyces noursei PD-1]UWS69860.1 hypothetical protein N1H47_00335 [Streptomyces noursei]
MICKPLAERIGELATAAEDGSLESLFDVGPSPVLLQLAASPQALADALASSPEYPGTQAAGLIDGLCSRRQGSLWAQ